MAEVRAASRAARDLGRGWKIDPYVDIPPGATHELANLDEPGCVCHLRATTDRPHWRRLILRACWDWADEPAIEVLYGDFFCNGWGAYAHVASAMVVGAPHGEMNSYWPMQFHKGARITLENVGHETACVHYQVDVETGGEHEGHGYLHTQFRRSNPLTAGTTHLIAEGVDGHGMYSGTYLAWGSNSNGWWGEDEVKFWLDDDEDFPTVASTGLEDHMGGAWNFDVGRYKPLADDIASTCWFYLDRPSTARPALPSRDALSV